MDVKETRVCSKYVPRSNIGLRHNLQPRCVHSSKRSDVIGVEQEGVTSLEARCSAPMRQVHVAFTKCIVTTAKQPSRSREAAP